MKRERSLVLEEQRRASWWILIKTTDHPRSRIQARNQLEVASPPSPPALFQRVAPASFVPFFLQHLPTISSMETQSKRPEIVTKCKLQNRRCSKYLFHSLFLSPLLSLSLCLSVLFVLVNHREMNEKEKQRSMSYITKAQERGEGSNNLNRDTLKRSTWNTVIFSICNRRGKRNSGS